MSTNIEIIKKYYDLIANGNNETALNMIADDATWHSDEIGAPWSGIHHGINAIKQHFAAISGTTTNFQRFKQQFIEHEDLVIELGGLSCILNKTQQPFSTEYICIYKIKNNKIASYRIFEDSLKLFKAYFHQEEANHNLKFDGSVTTVTPNEMAKIIKAEQIQKHFPAKAPGAINLFKDNFISVGMVETNNYPSYPHRNDYDEIHYIIAGTAKFRHGNKEHIEISPGDVVYVKSPEEHEWFDCSPDFKLIFVQAGRR